MRHARRPAILVTLMLACSSAALFAACGTESDSTFSGPGDSGAGSSGFNPSFGDRDGSSVDPNDPASALRIEPATAKITVTNRSAPPTQAFTVFQGPGATALSGATWTLDSYDAGTIGANGIFTAKGTVGKTIKVTASYGGRTATATLEIAINLKEDLGDVTLPDGRVISQSAAGISPANRAALEGAPGTDTDPQKTKITYPYEGTVMPRGLLAPVTQFTPGTTAAQDFKVMLDSGTFHWEGFGHVGAHLEATFPQEVWAGALMSAALDPTTQKPTLTISIVKAVDGVAVGPASTHIIVAPASLTGVIYFSSYSDNQITMEDGTPGGTEFGLWSVRPGTTNPPSHLNTGCVICHSVSANGRTLVTGADKDSGGRYPGSGVYTTDGTTARKISNESTALTGDTRGLSWTAISPDGNYILRSSKDFWGGAAMMAWKTPPADTAVPADLTSTAPISGTNINVYVPSFSPDGRKLVYVNADSAYGTQSRSVGIMDIAIDAAGDAVNPNGTVTLANPRTIFDSATNAPTNHYMRLPTFLPDSESVVLQETDSNGTYSGFNGQLPNWTGAAHVYTPGVLYMLRPTTSGAYQNVKLTKANTGSASAHETANYEPKPLPVQAGGYFWVVFTSVRADGLQGSAIKKLWVTAISPNAPEGEDPSHPPFLLTNQAIKSTQACERGYWSVEPCRADGATCATGDDCCGGFCRPETDGDPGSPLVCKKPTTTTCAQIGDRCRAGHSEDCCATPGVACIGSLGGFGSCAVPGPK